MNASNYSLASNIPCILAGVTYYDGRDWSYFQLKVGSTNPTSNVRIQITGAQNTSITVDGVTTSTFSGASNDPISGYAVILYLNILN